MISVDNLRSRLLSLSIAELWIVFFHFDFDYRSLPAKRQIRYILKQSSIEAEYVFDLPSV